MTLSTPIEDTRTILLTDQMLEAADLTEMMERRGLEPVMTFRSAETARILLSAAQVRPDLVIFGLENENDPALDECLALINRLGSAVIFINGSAENIRGTEAIHIARPFTSRDVELALQRAGVIVR